MKRKSEHVIEGPPDPVADEPTVIVIPERASAPDPVAAPRVTVSELVALRRSIEAILSAENSVARASAAGAVVGWVDRELDQAGVAVVNGFVVEHGSTFNERTSEINGIAEPGDRVWTKATGWSVTPPKGE